MGIEGGGDHIHLGFPQSGGDRLPGGQMAIKPLHELGPGLIVDRPQGHQYGRRSGVEEGPIHALDAFSAEKASQSRLAG